MKNGTNLFLAVVVGAFVFYGFREYQKAKTMQKAIMRQRAAEGLLPPSATVRDYAEQVATGYI